MEHSRLSLLLFGISFICFFLCTQARWHNHTKHHKHNDNHKSPTISEPPTPAPEPANPSDGSGYNSSAVFDVRDFGAIGDGIIDDTDAFKMAWDAACNQVDSAAILVPSGFDFMIQSTIFTGPCHDGLVFQVLLFTSHVRLLFVPFNVNLKRLTSSGN